MSDQFAEPAPIEEFYKGVEPLPTEVRDEDPIHPSHYHAGGIECFDVIEALGANFNIGNVLKYIWRYKKKGGVDDLRKALTYLQREISSLGGQR